MNRTQWMIEVANDTGRKHLLPFCEGITRQLMADSSTSQAEKDLEIARTLRDMLPVLNDESLPWDLTEPTDEEKPSAPTESPVEIIHLDCTINISKIEPLLDFPLIPLGPLCEVCDCFRCRLLHRCEIKQPYTLAECKYRCNGRIARNVCQYARKRRMIDE